MPVAKLTPVKYVDANGNEVKLQNEPSYGWMVDDMGMAVADDENGTLWSTRGHLPRKGETIVKKVPDKNINETWKRLQAEKSDAKSTQTTSP